MSRHFPDFLRAYTEYSRHSEAPDKFHFWTGVSCIAGALRRKVHMDMGYFKWHPNFYIIFVAPPGIVSKSSTAAIGMNLLRQVPGIKFGADAVTWAALAQGLAGSREIYTDPDGKPKVMCALTMVSSELGTLLDPSDNEMMDNLVSLWDGMDGVWTKSTKTQGTDTIENPWINLIGCTTPAWIGQNVPEYIVGGGFTSRTIFVYAERKRKFVAYPQKELTSDHISMREKLIEDLCQIAELQGPYTLTSDALAWGEEWYYNHYTNPPAHLRNPRYGGYVARKQTHIHKLAMVIAAARSNALVITKDMLQAAEAIMSATEMDMPKVFQQIGADEHARRYQLIVNFVLSKGRVTRRELVGNFLSVMGLPDIQSALTAGVQSGAFTATPQDDEVWLQAPTFIPTSIEINLPEADQV